MKFCIRVLIVGGILFAAPSLAAGQTPCNPEPTDQPIAFGQVINCDNHIGDAGDFFRFSGTAGDRVRLVVTQLAGGGAGSNPCLDISPPVAAPFCSTTVVARDVTLPSTGLFTITVNEAGNDGAMNYSLELVCLSGTCALNSPAVCDMQMNQTTFTNGGTVSASVLRFVNNSPSALPVEFKLWFGVPGMAPLTVFNGGSNGSIVLPPMAINNYGPVPLFQVIAGFPRGTYEFSCRMLDPITGALLSEDRNFFVLQ